MAANKKLDNQISTRNGRKKKRKRKKFAGKINFFFGKIRWAEKNWEQFKLTKIQKNNNKQIQKITTRDFFLQKLKWK